MKEGRLKGKVKSIIKWSIAT